MLFKLTMYNESDNELFTSGIQEKMGGVGLTNFISGIQRVEIFATYNLSLRSESSSK